MMAQLHTGKPRPPGLRKIASCASRRALLYQDIPRSLPPRHAGTSVRHRTLCLLAPIPVQSAASPLPDPVLQAPWVLMTETDYVWMRPPQAPRAEDAGSPSWAFPFGYIRPAVRCQCRILMMHTCSCIWTCNKLVVWPIRRSISGRWTHAAANACAAEPSCHLC